MGFFIGRCVFIYFSSHEVLCEVWSSPREDRSREAFLHSAVGVALSGPKVELLIFRGAAESLSCSHEELKYLPRKTISKAFVRTTRPSLFALLIVLNTIRTCEIT